MSSKQNQVSQESVGKQKLNMRTASKQSYSIEEVSRLIQAMAPLLQQQAQQAQQTQPQRHRLSRDRVGGRYSESWGRNYEKRGETEREYKLTLIDQNTGEEVKCIHVGKDKEGDLLLPNKKVEESISKSSGRRGFTCTCDIKTEIPLNNRILYNGMEGDGYKTLKGKYSVKFLFSGTHTFVSKTVSREDIRKGGKLPKVQKKLLEGKYGGTAFIRAVTSLNVKGDIYYNFTVEKVSPT
jgi:hypothetical protein